MKKIIAVLIALCVLVLLAAGCTAPSAEKPPSKPEAVQDSLGRTVFLEKPPERIVSLMPSKTEKLFALGLGDKIVGVTNMCDYPEELKNREIARVGDAWNLSVEHIVALQPDLVAANWLPEGMDRQLADLGIAVFLYDPASVAEVLEGISRLGKLTGRQEAAQQVVAQLKGELDAIAGRVAKIGGAEKVRVLYLLDEFLWTAGKGTLQDDLLTLAGGINVVESGFWQQLNKEAFLACNPDVILYTFPGGAEFLADPQWQVLPCVREGRIYKLDESLASRPGPRITQGLEQIFSFLYPGR